MKKTNSKIIKLTKNEQRIVDNLMEMGKQMVGGGYVKADLIKQVTKITRAKRPPLTENQCKVASHYITRGIELSYSHIVEIASELDADPKADVWLPENWKTINTTVNK